MTGGATQREPGTYFRQDGFRRFFFFIRKIMQDFSAGCMPAGFRWYCRAQLIPMTQLDILDLVMIETFKKEELSSRENYPRPTSSTLYKKSAYEITVILLEENSNTKGINLASFMWTRFSYIPCHKGWAGSQSGILAGRLDSWRDAFIS